MRLFLQKIWRAVLDGVFPAYCLGCKAEGSFLCDQCQKLLQKLEVQVCPWCYKPSNFGQSCLGCGSGGHFLDGAVAATRFEEHSLLQTAIHNLKYEFVKELAEPLGEFLAEAFLRVVEKNSHANFILCPLPLHHIRNNWRGFNQSELLCSAALKKLHQQGFWNVEIQRLLERVHFSKPQMELSREERLTNVVDAFVMRKDLPATSDKFKHATVLLVDDIATTLSTLESAAKILKKSGFRHVNGLVLARVF